MSIDVWVKKLYDAGIRATTPATDAQAKLRELMEFFFSDIQNEQTDAGIEQMVSNDTFLSDPENPENLGSWNESYLPKLQEFETQAQPIVLTP